MCDAQTARGFAGYVSEQTDGIKISIPRSSELLEINAADIGNERLVNFASVARADLSFLRSGREIVVRACRSRVENSNPSIRATLRGGLPGSR